MEQEPSCAPHSALAMVVSISLSASIRKNGESLDLVCEYADGTPGNGRMSAFELTQIDDENRLTIAEATAAEAFIDEKLSLLLDHFEQRGFIRCDHISEVIEPDGDPSICLVGLCRDADAQGIEDWGINFYDVYENSGVVRSLDVTSGQYWTHPRGLATAEPQLVFEVLRSKPQADLRVRRAEVIGSDKVPKNGETFDDWLNRVAIPAAAIRRSVAIIEMVEADLEEYALLAGISRASAEFVVPGLIPKGTVTLLVGSRETGKTTAMHELCAKLECPNPAAQPHFLGVPVKTGLVTVFISGEDPLEFFSDRRLTFAIDWGDGAGLIIDATTKSIDEILPLLVKIKPDLIVIDPVRKFLDGEEDSSTKVNAFFEGLEKLNKALNKKCAIVVVHHCRKDLKARRLADIMPRGSGVFMDRPRVVLGMLLLPDGTTSVGILKHNFPPSVPMWERRQARHFRFNASTLCLEPIGVAPAASHRAAPAVVQDDATLEAVWDAVARLNTQGETVQQTGKRELFQLNLPHLAGLSRATLRAATTKLVEIGRLEHGPAGLIAKHTNLQ